MHSAGSAYATADASVSECAITSYAFAVNSNTGGVGDGSELTLDPTTGAFTIDTSTDYTYVITITICARSQTGTDCKDLTS